MKIEQKQIWDDKNSIAIQSKSKKVPFTRKSLRDYLSNYNYIYHLPSEKSFLDFFTEDSLAEMDEETGCYMSHLLFYDGYPEQINKTILSYLFKGYLSPNKNSIRGELYLDCLLKNPIYLFKYFYAIGFFEDAVDLYNVNFQNHVDYQGNNLMHLIAIGPLNSFVSRYIPFFDFDVIYKKNKNGLSVSDYWFLAKQLYLNNYYYSNHFTYHEEGDHIILDLSVPIDSLPNKRIFSTDGRFDCYQRIYPKDDLLFYLLTDNNWERIYLDKPSDKELEIKNFFTYTKKKEK